MDFCREGEIADPYLENFSAINRTRILCAFMDEVRNGKFAKQPSVKGTTAKQAADNVATTILSSGRKDPRLDQRGETHMMFKRQNKAYKKEDKPTKHQKAIPPEVYRQLLQLAAHPRAMARAELLAAALWFCMRSCEYSKTSRKEQKTKPITSADVTFRYHGLIIPHNSPYLDEAETVSITFRLQKCEVMHETVTQYRTDDPVLCPVKSWIKVIKRLRSYPKYDKDWPVYTYHNGQTTFTDISSTEILHDIRRVVGIIGESILGFTPDEVGTHSNRAGGAMMMYLSKVPIVTIMMIGRWHSNAFLTYIEKQVLQFSVGVSQAMLTYNTFYNVPGRPWTSTDQDEHSRSAHQYLPQLLHQNTGC